MNLQLQYDKYNCDIFEQALMAKSTCLFNPPNVYCLVYTQSFYLQKDMARHIILME